MTLFFNPLSLPLFIFHTRQILEFSILEILRLSAIWTMDFWWYLLCNKTKEKCSLYKQKEIWYWWENR